MSNVQCRKSNIDVKRAMSNVKYLCHTCNVESQMPNVECHLYKYIYVRTRSHPYCFLEGDTLPSLLNAGWFKKWIQV